LLLLQIVRNIFMITSWEIPSILPVWIPKEPDDWGKRSFRFYMTIF